VADGGVVLARREGGIALAEEFLGSGRVLLRLKLCC
jgi:hypothetical protein